MQVIKRDGRREDVAFEKVQDRITKAAEGLSVNPTKVAQGVLSRIVDGITTTELDNITANLAYSWSTTHPDYAALAARVALSNHQKNTPTRFVDVVNRLAAVQDKSGNPASLLDDAFVAAVNTHADEIESHIDYSRDFLLDYFGFKTLEKAYLLRDTNRVIVERPQHLWMRVALGLWMNDLPKAFETYDLLSQKYYTHATPTLFNAATKRPQLSSCFLLAMNDDSIRGIYKTLEDCALISQYGGGIGIHSSNIRAKGSLIKGTGGISNGLVPMLRVFNATARYVDQCFTPDTKIMVHTCEGNLEVPIRDIQEGMKVLTSGCEETNDDTGKNYVKPNVLNPFKGVPNKVLKKVKHNYSGKLYHIYFDTILPPISVTPKHPVLVKLNNGEYNYVEVEKLNVGDVIPNPWGETIIHDITTEDVENQELYDLEIENTHDYLVSDLGFVHNGGGKRNGSFAIYLEPWHADVEDFLELKKNTGLEEERARDLFYAMWAPDLFMERVDTNGDWTLFCPNEAPGLADAVGDDFKTLYERYEREGRGRKTIKAQKLWFTILDSQIETGTPYLCYKDAANKKSNQQNLGTIKSSNLCVAPETLVLTDKGEYPIKSIVNQTVNVWNGDAWSEVKVIKTGANQSLLSIQVKDHAYHSTCAPSTLPQIISICEPKLKTVVCTHYHKFIREDGTRIPANGLRTGTVLKQWVDQDGLAHYSVVHAIHNYGRTDDTYCFTEPINNAGVFNGVLTGNCTEIIEYSSPEETAVCNLASLSLPTFVKQNSAGVQEFDFAKLREVTHTVVRNLNRVIDVNYYPIPEAERSNKRHRPVGLGVQGLADVFALLGLPWESPEATTLNRRIFAHMYYAAVQSSIDLAATEGRYETFVGSPAYQGKLQFDLWGVEPLQDEGLDWDSLTNDLRRIGMRNSLLIAPMPTASTSQILGNCECIEPYATHIFTRRTLAGEFIVLNKHLVKALLERGLWNPTIKDAIINNNGSVSGIAEIPEDIQRIFKTVWEIKQKTLIDMAADRGPYICQSQSLNLFLADPDYKKLSSMHFYAWRKGLKTGIYYLRTRAAAQAQKFTVEPVVVPATTAAAAAAKQPEECLMCSS